MRATAYRAAVALVAALMTATSAPTADATAVSGNPPGAPTQLTVDDAAAPLAVEGAPQFGWVVNDPDRGEVQSAYELAISAIPTSGVAATVIWGSGEVRSSQQSYVTAPGLTLEPGHAYTWTVRTWDRVGRPGPFAKPAHFDTGIGDGDWGALWIRRPNADQAAYDDFSLLRKEFMVSTSPIVRARAYMSAGQQYDLRVNGIRAAHGPSFSYPDEQYYQATDITTLLHANASNAIGVIAHWSTPGQGRPASVPAFIARITIDHADGTSQVITSDATWGTHVGPWIPGLARNGEGEFVEHIDARLDPIGWDRPGFDDQGWASAAVLGPHPVAPFVHLYAARTEIVEHKVTPVSLVRLANGAYVADFGAVIAATPVVEFSQGVVGHGVTVVAGYLLDPNGHVSTTRATQQTDMHWEYDQRAGAQEFRPFGYLGYRYLEIDAAHETLTAADIVSYARHASMPDENAASFTTSNPAVDAVWNLARHSAMYGSQEEFIDTPTREKGAFMDPFDSAVTMAAFDERSLTFEALRDFARSQQRYWPDGRVNVVYPNGDGARDIPDSTEQFVEWVWRVYQTTGDLAQVAALYPVVKNISDYLNRAVSPTTGLVTNLPGGGTDYLYGLVDWPPQSRFGYDMATAARTTENLLAVDDFRDVADLARALGRTAEADVQLSRATSLTTAIKTQLRRADGLLVDGLEASGTPSAHVSQLANAYALAFHLVPASDLSAVANFVVSRGNQTGVSTFSNLLVGLHNAGRDQALIAAITDPSRPGYAQILKEGATYTWESWDARQTGDSESHGFGSPVLTVLQDDILGVSLTAPGAATVDVRTPQLEPMRASGVYVTQRGRIPISWDRPAPGHFSLDVTIPANVIATVHLPASKVKDVGDGKHTIARDPGVTAVRLAPGEVVLTIGSGHYQFTVPSRAPGPTHVSLWLLALAIAALVLLAAALLTRRVGGARRRRGLAASE